jgi:hypothetical protein
MEETPGEIGLHDVMVSKGLFFAVRDRKVGHRSDVPVGYGPIGES